MNRLIIELNLLDPAQLNGRQVKAFIKRLNVILSDVCEENELMFERLECLVTKLSQEELEKLAGVADDFNEFEDEDEEEYKEELPQLNINDFKKLLKSTYYIEYDEVRNVVYIGGSKKDFDAKFLEYLLEYKDIPKSATKVFTKDK